MISFFEKLTLKNHLPYFPIKLILSRIKTILTQNKIPSEIILEIFKHLDLHQLHSLGATSAELTQIARSIKFNPPLIPQPTYVSSGIYSHSKICHPSQIWFLCDPTLFNVYLSVYPDEMHKVLFSRICSTQRHQFVIYFAVFDRIDLIKIIWDKFKSFINVDSFLENGALNGSVNVVKFFAGKSKSSKGMDGAAFNGHLEILQWLHENGHSCSDQALIVAARK